MVSHPAGAGEWGRLSQHCSTEFADAEFTDAAQAQGVWLVPRGGSSTAKGCEPAAHTELGIVHSPAHPAASARVTKATEAASQQLPSARGLCPKEGRGEASGTLRTPNSPPGKTGLWWHLQQTACFDRNPLQKHRERSPSASTPNVTASYP